MRVDRRWILAGLGVSLLLNLFLASVLIGRGLATPAALPGGSGLAPPASIRLLSPQERSAFLKAMAPHRPSIRQARMAQRAARATVEADIRAESLNRPQLAADLAALRQAQDRQLVEVHAGLIDALGALSPASRAALAARGVGPRTRAPSSPPAMGNAEPAP